MFGLFDKKSKEDKFWTWFEKNSRRYLTLDKSNREILFDELNRELDKVDSNLTFEFSPLFDNGRREFIISADGIKESFPSVKNLVSKAPVIPNWDIIAFRQPKADYKQISYKGIKIDFKDVYFRYSKDNGKIGLELNIKDYEDTKEWNASTFLLLDMVVGEFDTEMFLSWIERKKLDENQIEILYKIEELPTILNDYKKEFSN